MPRSEPPPEETSQVATSTPLEPAPPSTMRSEIEVQLARDRNTLKDLISRTDPGGRELASDPLLRELAERLPRLERELEEARED